MIYVLKQSGRIVSWSETPFGLGENQTQEEVEGTTSDYENRCKLTVDKTQIVANGVDEAVVTLSSNTETASIDVLVNETPVTVNLVDGAGQLPAITSEETGLIEIMVSDETLFSRAGMGQLVIQVVEA